MISWFRKLWKNKRGNALVIAGAALPMIVGAAGLANDTIQWTLWKRQLQRAADSAAIAGVYTREKNDSQEAVETSVNHDLTLNRHMWTSLHGTPVIERLSNSGVMQSQVRVTLEIQQRLPFSSMFMSAAPVIRAVATAASLPAGGDACVQALETNASRTGINNTGNTAIYMPDCVMYSNSPSANSASAGGSSDVTALSIAAVGGIQQTNNWHVGSYRPYSPSLPDPFANVNPSSSDMKCAVKTTTANNTYYVTVVDTPAWTEPAWTEPAWTETVVKNKKTTTIIHPAVYHPAVEHPAVTHQEARTATTTTYTPLALDDSTVFTGPNAPKDRDGNPANCFTSLSVGSNRSLSIPDDFGPIYINGGGTDIKGDFSCSHCTLVLTNKDPASSTIGTLGSNAQANINITAPTSGTFKGIAIYQDRRAADMVNKVNGGSSSKVVGAVYFPSSELWYNGGGNVTAVCTMIVAKRITFTGNSAVSNKFKKLSDCAAEGLPSSSTIRMIRLVG